MVVPHATEYYESSKLGIEKSLFPMLILLWPRICAEARVKFHILERGIMGRTTSVVREPGHRARKSARSPWLVVEFWSTGTVA